MFPRVVDVEPMENYRVNVTFDDGKMVCYHAEHLLQKPAFSPLKDADFYMEACTVMNGTLAWDLTGDRDPRSCLDIDPLMLYEMEC